MRFMDLPGPYLPDKCIACPVAARMRGELGQLSNAADRCINLGTRDAFQEDEDATGINPRDVDDDPIFQADVDRVADYQPELRREAGEILAQINTRSELLRAKLGSLTTECVGTLNINHLDEDAGQSYMINICRSPESPDAHSTIESSALVRRTPFFRPRRPDQ